MASQSARNDLRPAYLERKQEYLAGWAAITQLMDQGKSWSGHERNCSYLNLGDGTFADVSSASGLNLEDDGRCVAVTDWDSDGDLDFWFKNRTSPQLRFMANAGNPGAHYLALGLVGTQCNRDAIGAIVRVYAEGAVLVRTLLAGQGYLSQSSKWVHFGLGTRSTIDKVTVTWPDGMLQEWTGMTANARYRLTQASEAAERIQRKPIASWKELPADVPPPGTARIVLKEALPLPPSIHDKFKSEQSSNASVVTLWAGWCAPCWTELGDWAKKEDRLVAAGIEVWALNIDAPDGQAAALQQFSEQISSEQIHAQPADATVRELLRAVVAEIGRKPLNSLQLPTSLLLDGLGQVQVIYLGPVSAEQLGRDTAEYAQQTKPLHQRTSFEGRWFFRTPRHYGSLADHLQQANLGEEAVFYRNLRKPTKRPRPARTATPRPSGSLTPGPK